MRIGVVGYSAAKFDVDTARVLVRIGLDKFLDSSRSQPEIVSGLTNLGIPALAYEYAKQCYITTVGIACTKAYDYDCFPVDKRIMVGKEWGDESETFLNYIDCLLRVGGGKQSHEEVQAFRKLKPRGRILELELPEIK